MAQETQLNLGIYSSPLKGEPFLKWAGSKTSLLNKLIPLFPKNFKYYYEPFLGGGSVALYLSSNFPSLRHNMRLSDINTDLISTYIAIRDSIESTINILNEYEERYLNSSFEDRKEMYNYIRRRYNDRNSNDISCLAAIFIFLNKTCYNGLTRYNKKGEFNTPFGDGKDKQICMAEKLHRCSELLQNVDIYSSNYNGVDLNLAEIKESFFYLDPPYHQRKGFTSYVSQSFKNHEQKELASFCHILDKRGSYFLLSNSADDMDFLYPLYRNFSIQEIEASRNIGGKGASRQKVKEIIVKNY